MEHLFHGHVIVQYCLYLNYVDISSDVVVECAWAFFLSRSFY